MSEQQPIPLKLEYADREAHEGISIEQSTDAIAVLFQPLPFYTTFRRSLRQQWWWLVVVGLAMAYVIKDMLHERSWRPFFWFGFNIAWWSSFVLFILWLCGRRSGRIDLRDGNLSYTIYSANRRIKEQESWPVQHVAAVRSDRRSLLIELHPGFILVPRTRRLFAWRDPTALKQAAEALDSTLQGWREEEAAQS